MPELPKVSQDFTADVSDYVAKMQLMIDETERFVGEIDDAIAKIGEFKAALDSLPDMKVVTIVTKYVTDEGQVTLFTKEAQKLTKMAQWPITVSKSAKPGPLIVSLFMP